jgi:CO/xanthine dehydrogenase Mo-binding subunit
LRHRRLPPRTPKGAPSDECVSPYRSTGVSAFPATPEFAEGRGRGSRPFLDRRLVRDVLAADARRYGADGFPGGTVDDPTVFVNVGTDGTVTIMALRPEMGQGVRTGLPVVIADEMEADWSRVRVVQAPGDQQKYGNQNTDGSRSTRHFFTPMRRVGAAARGMLEAAAAKQWNVPVAEGHAIPLYRQARCAQRRRARYRHG